MVNSSRTIGVNGYNVDLSEDNIDHMCEYVGYELYQPMFLIHDLVNVYSNLMLKGDYKLSYNSNTTDLLKEFFNNIPYEMFIGETPLERAIVTLKELSTKYNLRSLNKGEIKKGKLEDNFFVQLDDRDTIPMINYTSIDYSKVLKLSCRIASKLNLSPKNPIEKDSSKMKSYSDIFKIKKSNLKRPDFNIKFISKSFNTTNDISEDKSDILVYIEDGSVSMSKGGHLDVINALRRGIIDDYRELHYYRHMGVHLELYKLKTREEKIDIFKSKNDYHKYILNYKLLYKELDKYKSGEVIMVTDGNDYVPKYKSNLKINFICTESYDTNIFNICKYSGGKMLLL